MPGHLDESTSDDDDFSLHSPKAQDQLRDEALTTTSHVLASGVWSYLANLGNAFRFSGAMRWDNQMSTELM